MGIRDHKQRRKGHKGPRPLTSAENVTVNRYRFTNGVHDLTNPCASHLYRYFKQSAYISGNFKDPNSHSFDVQRLYGLQATLAFEYTNGTKQLITGAMDGLINFRSLKTADFRNTRVLDDARRKAYEKFYTSLRDSELNLAVDIAEGKQSAKMMSNSIRDVVRIARQCRRDALKWAQQNLLIQQMKPSKERRRVRDSIPAKYRGETDPSIIMGNRWLEWQYGWKPLLGTIFGACDFERRKPRQSFRIVGNSKRRSIQIVPTSTSYGFVVWNDAESSSYATLRCDYRVNSSVANNASRFTSMNPLAIAWELVPYSFVVDWFFNVGGYMQELETCMESGLTFVRGYEVYTLRYINKVTFPSGAGTSTNPKAWNMYTSKTREYRAVKTRVRLTSTPFPFFPRLEAKLGAQRLLSGAALLRQLFTFRK